MSEKKIKIALFTDTICDANGVSRFLQDMAKEALKKEVELNILSSTAKTYCDPLENIHIFKPFFRIKMPYYKELDLVMPPVFKMAKRFKQLDPDIVHISTPGLVGLAGLLIAMRYKKPVTGTYHTDFPSYIYKNTNSKTMGRFTGFYMRLFYKRFKALATRSKEYIKNIKRDIKFQKPIEFLQPGTNIKTFDPKYRDKTIWENYKLNPEYTMFLYVGRVTKEKNIDTLFEIWKEFYEISSLKSSYLVIVGSGELVEKYEQQLKPYNIVFLGHKKKEELSTLYASSDIFLFPSTTDTLGQVVLEAMASATGVIVTDEGGPCEIVRGSEKEVGFIISIDDEAKWMQQLIKIEDKTIDTKALSTNAYEYSKNFSIERTFESFMNFHQRQLKNNILKL